MIKLARADDIDWINNKYKEVNFLPSNLSKEKVAIAEIQGERAGLGRLVQIDNENAELGGMYVFDEFRNQGVARAIVEFLLSQGKEFQFIYCLPFEQLKKFYESFGFIECDAQSVPEDIRNKYQWCNQTYADKVLLLRIANF